MTDIKGYSVISPPSETKFDLDAIVWPDNIKLELPCGSWYFNPQVLTITADTLKGVSMGHLLTTIYNFYQKVVDDKERAKFLGHTPSSSSDTFRHVSSSLKGAHEIIIRKKGEMYRHELLFRGFDIVDFGHAGTTPNHFYISLF